MGSPGIVNCAGRRQGGGWEVGRIQQIGVIRYFQRLALLASCSADSENNSPDSCRGRRDSHTVPIGSQAAGPTRRGCRSLRSRRTHHVPVGTVHSLHSCFIPLMLIPRRWPGRFAQGPAGQERNGVTSTIPINIHLAYLQWLNSVGVLEGSGWKCPKRRIHV